MSKKIVITGCRTAGIASAQALIAALAARGFEVEETALQHNDHIDFPEVQELSAHPLGKLTKPKRRKLKRKGGSKL